MTTQAKKTVYNAKTIFPGGKVGCGMGWYAGVPDKGYKGHPFTIIHYYASINDKGEQVYKYVEVKVQDWNKAEAFRKQVNQFGGGGFFTLGYFKVADQL